MDYIDAFRNLRTNNKYGRKSPHKAVLMLTVIEMFEMNILMDNEIYYDDKLKSTFLKVWNRVIPNEPLFHPDAYLPFWYLQSDSFWHIVPIRGKEDILSLMRDTNIKPSEAKLNDSVKCAELDDDLFFLMTIASGRSSLKRALLETYTTLSEKQIDRMTEHVDNTIDHSAVALADYEKILSQEENQMKTISIETDNELVRQFKKLNEELQIVLNIQYFSFLKSHRNEREMFKDICPTVYDLLDKIVNHPVKQGDISPSFAFTYDIFLSDLKISLMSEDGSIELIDKINNAIEILRENKCKDIITDNNLIVAKLDANNDEHVEPTIDRGSQEPSYDDLEIEHVYLDSLGRIIHTIPPKTLQNNSDKEFSTENRKGKPWTQNEEELITLYFKQGKDAAEIAKKVGRTEVSIMSRLGKLGLIDYKYGHDIYISSQTVYQSPTDNNIVKNEGNSDYRVENGITQCAIIDTNGKPVFIIDGKFTMFNGIPYRCKLKTDCFVIKRMIKEEGIWLLGRKVIRAFSQSALYQVVNNADFIDDIEDIVESGSFGQNKIKVKGVWYNFKGDQI